MQNYNPSFFGQDRPSTSGIRVASPWKENRRTSCRSRTTTSGTPGLYSSSGSVPSPDSSPGGSSSTRHSWGWGTGPWGTDPGLSSGETCRGVTATTGPKAWVDVGPSTVAVTLLISEPEGRSVHRPRPLPRLYNRSGMQNPCVGTFKIFGHVVSMIRGP